MDLDQLWFRLVECERLIRNLVRFGEVDEVDADKGTARMIDRGGGPGRDVPFPHRPWAEVGAPDAGGNGATWRPPAKGSRMMAISPGGNLANALLFHAAFSDKVKAPSSDPDAHVETKGKARVEWSKDKVQLEHDGAIITLQNGVITIKAATALNFEAPDITIKGKVHAEGDWVQVGIHTDSRGKHR
jgi:phage baseplate assembly protein gpV